MVVKRITSIRHGSLKNFSALWSILRFLYRCMIIIFPKLKVSKKIGSYGPFKLNRRFAFSNFEAWGEKHNRGFDRCVKAAKGMSCVLDIGAHIGLVTMPLSQVVANNGTVYAFEPAAANRAYLIEHLTANQIGNVEVIPDLVGDIPLQSVEFFESSSDSGMNTIAVSGHKRGYGSTQKHQVTLDWFCNKRNLSPELIKIDTEGAEVGILDGAVNTIRKYKPIIFLSVHPRHIVEVGSTVKKLEHLLADLNYQVTDMYGNVVRPIELSEYVVSPKL